MFTIENTDEHCTDCSTNQNSYNRLKKILAIYKCKLNSNMLKYFEPNMSTKKC